MSVITDENIDMVRILLNCPTIDVNITDKVARFSALYYAVKVNNKDIVEELLKVPGINVNIKSTNSKTPLNYTQNKDIQKLLIQAGAIETSKKRNNSNTNTNNENENNENENNTSTVYSNVHQYGPENEIEGENFNNNPELQPKGIPFGVSSNTFRGGKRILRKKYKISKTRKTRKAYK